MGIVRTSTSKANGTGTTLTFAHTVSGSNTILFVAVRTDSVATPDTVTGVTYNAAGMTFIAKASYSFGEIYLYYLVVPTTGANNIVISRSAGTVTLYGYGVSYSGVKQTGQPDASDTANGSSRSISVALTTIANPCWMIAIAANQDASVATTSSQNLLNADTGGTGSSGVADTNTEVAPGSNSMGFAWSTSNQLSSAEINVSFSGINTAFTVTVAETSLSVEAHSFVLAFHLLFSEISASISFASLKNAISNMFSKHSVSMTNTTKNNASATNATKNSSNWSNTSKS